MQKDPLGFGQLQTDPLRFQFHIITTWGLWIGKIDTSTKQPSVFLSKITTTWNSHDHYLVPKTLCQAHTCDVTIISSIFQLSFSSVGHLSLICCVQCVVNGGIKPGQKIASNMLLHNNLCIIKNHKKKNGCNGNSTKITLAVKSYYKI